MPGGRIPGRAVGACVPPPPPPAPPRLPGQFPVAFVVPAPLRMHLVSEGSPIGSALIAGTFLLRRRQRADAEELGRHRLVDPTHTGPVVPAVVSLMQDRAQERLVHVG